MNKKLIVGFKWIMIAILILTIYFGFTLPQPALFFLPFFSLVGVTFIIIIGLALAYLGVLPDISRKWFIVVVAILVVSAILIFSFVTTQFYPNGLYEREDKAITLLFDDELLEVEYTYNSVPPVTETYEFIIDYIIYPATIRFDNGVVLPSFECYITNDIFSNFELELTEEYKDIIEINGNYNKV